MTTASLDSGKCPECGGSDVYTNRGKEHAGHRTRLVVTPSRSIELDTYLCMACGHFEEIVPEGQLAEQAATVRSNWSKV